jgi:hypothetical protein
MKLRELSDKELHAIRDRNDKLILKHVERHGEESWSDEIAEAHAENYRVISELFIRIEVRYMEEL